MAVGSFVASPNERGYADVFAAARRFKVVPVDIVRLMNRAVELKEVILEWHVDHLAQIGELGAAVVGFEVIPFDDGRIDRYRVLARARPDVDVAAGGFIEPCDHEVVNARSTVGQRNRLLEESGVIRAGQSLNI